VLALVVGGAAAVAADETEQAGDERDQ